MTHSARPPRSEFARHFSLDPSVTYLNHGAFGACPVEVQKVQEDYRARLERNPMHFFLRELEHAFDGVRTVLSPFVGAKPEDLAFVPNATAGVNTVLASIEQAP